MQSVECLLICLAPFFHVFSCECPMGCRGTALPSPCINILSAVARWLHESEDSMPQAEKTKNVSQKALLGLQRYNQTKVNPRWWIYSNFERAVARHIKTCRLRLSYCWYYLHRNIFQLFNIKFNNFKRCMHQKCFKMMFFFPFFISAALRQQNKRIIWKITTNLQSVFIIRT